MNSRAIVLATALCVSLGITLAPSPAFAVQVTQHSFTSSFDGTGSTAGPFETPLRLDVDEATGNVYVLDEHFGEHFGLNESVIDKFDASGNPEAFTAPDLAGTTSLPLEGYVNGEVPMAVDNSGTATQGRIYYDDEEYPGFTAFQPSGDPVGAPFPITHNSLYDIAATKTGLVWVSGYLAGKFVENNPVTQYTSNGEPTGVVALTGDEGSYNKIAVDSNGNLYVDKYYSRVEKYNASGEFQYVVDSGTNIDVAVDPTTNDVYLLQREPTCCGSQVHEYSPEGISIASFPVENTNAIAVNGETGDVYVAEEYPTKRIAIYGPGATVTLPTPLTRPASDFTPLGATLNGAVVPEGIPTTNCHFEWGTDATYGHSVPCAQGSVLNGSGSQAVPVSAEISGLSKGITYHYRVVAGNGSGTLKGKDATFVASEAPVVGGEFVSNVHSDSAEFHADVNPEGAETSFHFEYGTVECAVEPSACSSSAEIQVGSEVGSVHQMQDVKGLQQGTTYHYRIVASNQTGTAKGGERTVTTFPLSSAVSDACTNAHVRQQTGGALLLDCRAYELASAANTGGYDVESSLVAGEVPFGGPPEATSPSRILYGVHDGGIPGANHPTNRGVDPYVATREADGWATEYVGIPANNAFAAAPFSSTPTGEDAGLGTFAFGGTGGCSPCFAGGYTGVPVRLENGEVVQGMAASSDVPTPPASATADGFIAKHLSGNGRHFIFGSASRFAEGGNQNGDISIYDRDLLTHETHLVSTDASGNALACLQGAGKCNSAEGDTNGISELDISRDGSHILIGQKDSTDADGNPYWHLYLNVGDSPDSVPLTPGASQGVLFDGMTADGSKVFLSSDEHLTGEDTQHSGSAIYMWSQKGEEEGHPLALVSKGDNSGNPGEPGNTSSCSPDHDWNTVAGGPNCSAVAIGGGGGVASGDGTIYFLSPELLDGASNGTEGEPNLYVARPDSSLEFIATIDTSEGKLPPAPSHPAVRTFGNFEKASFIAIDHSSGPSLGDVYVADTATNTLRKFDASGNPIASWATGGSLSAGYDIGGVGVDGTGTVDVFDRTNERLVQYTEAGIQSKVLFNFQSISPDGMAIDNEGNFYKINPPQGFPPYVKKYDSSGNELGIVTLLGGYEPVGMGVDPGTNNLYVVGADGSIQRFVFGASANQVIEPGEGACTLSSAGCKPTSTFARGLSGASAIAFDSAGHYVYVDQRNKITQFDSTGNRLQTTWTGASIAKSTGLAVGLNGHIYATSTGATHAEVVEYGVQPAPFEPIDNPVVVHAVKQPGASYAGDFQVSPNGSFAVFPTKLPLSGYDNDGHTELFRYYAANGESTCVSCAPTGARATGDASLAPDGLSITGDGKVFFDSTDPIAPRDLDEVQDSYEWEPLGVGPEKGACSEASLGFSNVSGGCLELISTGTSPFPSALLGVSASGKDAYFFTRDKLVPQDENGNLVKIYDAREEGGFPYLEPEVPCKASDECHGAGSAAPGPTGINTIKGNGGNAPPANACRKGFAVRHGKCVKRRKPRHHRERGRGTHKNAGGTK